MQATYKALIGDDLAEALRIYGAKLHGIRDWPQLLYGYARAGWGEAVRFLDALEAAEATRPLADALAVMVRLEPPLPEAVEWAAKIEFRWPAGAVAAELRGDDIGAAALYRAVLTVRPGNREALSSTSRPMVETGSSSRARHWRAPGAAPFCAQVR